MSYCKPVCFKVHQKIFFFSCLIWSYEKYFLIGNCIDLQPLLERTLNMHRHKSIMNLMFRTLSMVAHITERHVMICGCLICWKFSEILFFFQGTFTPENQCVSCISIFEFTCVYDELFLSIFVMGWTGLPRSQTCFLLPESHLRAMQAFIHICIAKKGACCSFSLHCNVIQWGELCSLPNIDFGLSVQRKCIQKVIALHLV